MTIDEHVKEITMRLDGVFDEYKNKPGFQHPIKSDYSPEKDYWESEFPMGYYVWVLRYMTGATRDSSATMVKYFSDKEPKYQIIWGKEREPTNGNLKSSDLDEIVKMFELIIIENIIGGRPRINLGVF